MAIKDTQTDVNLGNPNKLSVVQFKKTSLIFDKENTKAKKAHICFEYHYRE